MKLAADFFYCVSWANQCTNITKSTRPRINKIFIFNINDGLFWAKEPTIITGDT